MRTILSHLVTGIMLLCAVAVTVLVIRREVFPPRAAAAMLDLAAVPDWRAIAKEGHSMGPDSAPVVVTEFADFECPACALFYQRMDSLSRAHPGLVRLVFRHYPVKGHRFAVPAARASECAASQGAFEPMYNALFTYRDSVGLVPWTWFASTAGVRDTAAFASCTRQSTDIPALQRDTSAARRLQIAATPLVVLGGQRFYGAPPFDTLAALVQRAARSSQSR
ncbi:MAG TPA: thioredoxin domain-containing protein [Gemmatimonadaceae bacterium]|nr:thioredoxin domain-containing protein [Gemmatimonadaceae bacterium]